MSMPMLAGVGLLVVCCSSSSAAALMMGGGDDDDDKKKNVTGPTGPTGPAPPPPPGKVKGWGRTTTSLKNVEGIPTPEGCMVEAKKVGSPVWIHRNSGHGGMPNSCDIKAWSAPYAGDEADSVHIQGCTYGGNPETGCAPNPSMAGYPKGATNFTPHSDFETLDPNECVIKGAEIGAKMWGYRTANHPSPNSCFFYSNADAHTNDVADISHISGCVNSNKSLSNACA